jgi:hypothetical protein
MAQVRERISPPPRQWPNGSAVFATGFTRLGLKLNVREEDNQGFLGRIQRIPGGKFKVWDWLDGEYKYLGVTFSYTDALALIGGNPTSGKKIETKRIREEPEKIAPVRIEAELKPLPPGIKPTRLRQRA